MATSKPLNNGDALIQNQKILTSSIFINFSILYILASSLSTSSPSGAWYVLPILLTLCHPPMKRSDSPKSQKQLLSWKVANFSFPFWMVEGSMLLARSAGGCLMEPIMAPYHCWHINHLNFPERVTQEIIKTHSAFRCPHDILITFVIGNIYLVKR